MRKIFLLLCIAGLNLSNSIAAISSTTQPSHYNDGIQFSQSHNNQTTTAAQKTSPSVVPGFQSDHPTESAYAGIDMKSAAVSQVSNNKGAASVVESEHLRQKIELPAKNDPLIVQAKAITDQAKSVTNSASPFCVNGECETHTPIPAPNTYGDIARLSGIAAASQDKKGQFVFRGNEQDCHSDSFGFNNCCANSGWGQDLSLAQCNRYEQALGQAKEAGLCHEIGEFCSDDFWGFCTEHSKSYCCFPSKLARVIQEQGRNQLHRRWGVAENPDCSGLSVNELQKINFSAIDFSEVYADMKSKQHLPNEADVNKRIDDDVKRLYSQDAP